MPLTIVRNDITIMDVVAGGVEYEQQKQYLFANGCDKIQGYLISRPIDAQAAMELLRNSGSTC